MNQVLTVSCKLQVSLKAVAKIEATLKAFADACEWVNQEVKPNLMNELAIQSLVYQDVRTKFDLSAQLAIHAIRRVAGNRKTAKKDNKPVKGFKPTSATYDIRSFSFREKDWTVSLTMVGGRERFGLAIGNYQRGLLKGQNPKSATLSKRKDGSYYLNIQLESIPPEPVKTDNVLGCDLGRTDICVTSEGEKFSGKQITKNRNKYAQLRAKLQQKAAKGTRSTRRRCRGLLKRLSGKEKRFQSHTNHTVSYRLVQQAKVNSQVIALENLTKIRERTNQLPQSRKNKRLGNSWAFYQLRQYLTYKAVKFGVELVFVDPRYTSQMCHQCYYIHPDRGESYRNGKRFACGHCSWSGDADYNGSRNIAALAKVLLDAPCGSGLSCSLNRDDLGLLKSLPSALAG
jgi:IS605 OrfB family transposase